LALGIYLIFSRGSLSKSGGFTGKVFRSYRKSLQELPEKSSVFTGKAIWVYLISLRNLLDWLSGFPLYTSDLWVVLDRPS
jgi:hypothetical protein